MPRGPLPDPNAQRRNAATIPTTKLPAAGRSDPIPDPPERFAFGAAARDWWDWAWRTSEAAAWGTGALDAAARRAALEDDLAAIELVGHVNLHDLLGAGYEDDAMVDRIDVAIRTLVKLAGGKLAILKEIGRLDTELGLTPKAKAALRWEVAADQPAKDTTVTPSGASGGSRNRLRVVSGGSGA